MNLPSIPNALDASECIIPIVNYSNSSSIFRHLPRGASLSIARVGYTLKLHLGTHHYVTLLPTADHLDSRICCTSSRGTLRTAGRIGPSGRSKICCSYGGGRSSGSLISPQNSVIDVEELSSIDRECDDVLGTPVLVAKLGFGTGANEGWER